jgi:hypothetical protein
MRPVEYRERGEEERGSPFDFYGSGHTAGDLGFTIRGVIVGDGGRSFQAASGLENCECRFCLGSLVRVRVTLAPESEHFSLPVRVPSHRIGCYANKKAMLDYAGNLIQFSSKTFGVEQLLQMTV